jgi:hypothetical protein
VLFKFTGKYYQAKRPRLRLPIIVARVWPARKRDLPGIPARAPDAPSRAAGLHRDDATPT